MNREEAFADVFVALRDSGLRFCSLRDDLDSSASSGDLDLLVARERREDVLVCLETLGFRIKTTSVYIPYKVALLRFSNKMFQAIDLHFEVVQDGFIVLDADEVLDDCVGVRQYYLPAEYHLFAIVAVHNLVGKRVIQEKHVGALNDASRNLTSELLRDRLSSAAGLADALIPLLGNIDAYTTDSLRTRKLRESIIAVLRRNDPGSWWVRARRDIARFLRRWRLRARAPCYAFLGGDGVGKSSLCDALVEQLNAGGQMRAVQIYMGPWGHYLLPFMRGELFVPGWSVSTRDWLRGMTKSSANKAYAFTDVLTIMRRSLARESLSSAEQALHDVIKTQSRLYLTAQYVRSSLAAWRFLVSLMLEMCYRYYKAYKLRRRGIIVVADRYIYDLMTGRMHEEIENYARTRRFMCKVFFRPTRSVLLINDPDVILSRKQDLSAEQLDRFARIYAKLADEYGFTLLKTDQPPQELASQFVVESFEEIMAFTRT